MGNGDWPRQIQIRMFASHCVIHIVAMEPLNGGHFLWIYGDVSAERPTVTADHQ